MALPLVHGAVAGSPGIAGFEENVQLDALVTVALRVTLPPEEGNVAALSVNEMTFGGISPETVTFTAVAWTVSVPVTASLNLYLIALEGRIRRE